MDGFAIAAIIGAAGVFITAAAAAFVSIIRELRATHAEVKQAHTVIKEIDAAVNDKRTEDPTVRQNVQKLRDRSDRDEDK